MPGLEITKETTMRPPDESHARKLAERYDREASAYRELWAPILRNAGRCLLTALAGPGVERILDVGTGVGSLFPDIRKAFPGAFVLGIDRSCGMLALAPPELHRLAMDATRLAVPSRSMDLVLMVFVLFHLERPVDGVREARRVLRPGGRVGCVTWARSLESSATRTWADCLDAHGAIAEDPATEARHDLVDTPGKMESLLGVAGFARARSWEDDLVSTIDVEHVLRLKTTLGSSKPRFDSLARPAQEVCLAAARRRMEALAAEDFVARGKVVCSIASV